MKFIHAADLHLDSPLRGLARYPGAPVDEARGATRRALENLVRLAVGETGERVDFVLIAGDVYDGDWRDYQTGLFFASQMSILREAGIPVFVISGNHDARSIISKSLRLPENVRTFPVDRAGTAVLEEAGVAVHGHGYADRWVTADLSLGYPSPLRGYCNVGLLHTSASGHPPHEQYAPCAVEGLVDRGYEYWALGHVHHRIVLHRDPWVVFSGCIQGRHVQESGPRGCTVVDVEDGEVQDARHVDLDVIRWSRCVVEAGGFETVAQVLEAVRARLAAEVEAAGGRLLAVRVELAGSTAAHEGLWADTVHLESEIRALATDVAPEAVWVEQVRVRTASRVPPQARPAPEGPLGALLASISRYRADPDLLVAELGASRQLREVADLAAKLGHDGELAGALAASGGERTPSLLDEVEGLLLTRLEGDGAG